MGRILFETPRNLFITASGVRGVRVVAAHVLRKDGFHSGIISVETRKSDHADPMGGFAWNHNEGLVISSENDDTMGKIKLLEGVCNFLEMPSYKFAINHYIGIKSDDNWLVGSLAKLHDDIIVKMRECLIERKNSNAHTEQQRLEAIGFALNGVDDSLADLVHPSMTLTEEEQRGYDSIWV